MKAKKKTATSGEKRRAKKDALADFGRWMQTAEADDFFRMSEGSRGIVMLCGWRDMLPHLAECESTMDGGGFVCALAGMCHAVMSALHDGDNDLMSRAEMLQGLEKLCAVDDFSNADYVRVVYPLARMCVKSGVTALQKFDPAKHKEMGRLICALDKFDFMKKNEVPHNVDMLSSFSGLLCSMMDNDELPIKGKLNNSCYALNAVCREIGGAFLEWLKVANIRDNFALSKVRETVTGDESARAKFLSPFAYNERLDYVEFFGGDLWREVLNAARFESSRAGAAHAGEIATAATVAQPQHGAAAGGSCAAAGHVGAADDLLNENAAQFVTDYKPGLSFRFTYENDNGVPVGVCFDIQKDFSNNDIGQIKKLLGKDYFEDGWCRIDKWKPPSPSKCSTEAGIFFSHVECKWKTAKTKEDLAKMSAGDKYRFRIVKGKVVRAGGVRLKQGRPRKTK